MGNKKVEDNAKRLELGGWQLPLFFDIRTNAGEKAFLEFKSSGKVTREINNIEYALEELFDIECPAKKDNKTRVEVNEFITSKVGSSQKNYGVWVFFPWSGYLVHFPNKVDLRSLRTSRNRNLVTTAEQSKLYQARILVLGLSVGSNVAEALVSQGIGGVIGLIDLDVLEPTNLNRIRMPYHEIGQHKVDALAKRISEIDPFIEQIHFREGVGESNYQQIIDSVKPDIIVDEMDDLKMKILIRESALKQKIPVIMATDDGDDVLLDIERFDKEDRDIFHGILPKSLVTMIKNDQIKDRNELGKIIGQYFVGFENIPKRMMESLQEVGLTLPSWPQLGGAAALAGIMVAYAAKGIILETDVESNRFLCGPGTKRSLL